MSLSSILKEPLFHFLLIGLAIFAYFEATSEPQEKETFNDIVISSQTLERIGERFEATWKRPPSPQERNALLEDFLREEIFVREALALGMDRNDPVIRKRLRQKMEFLTDAAAATAFPSDDALLDHYAKHQEVFRIDGRIAFSHVFLGPKKNSETTASVLSALIGGADPNTLGDRILIPPSFPLSPVDSIDGTFGVGFYSAIDRLQGSAWEGPVRSGYGYHLIYVHAREEAYIPALEDVRDKVYRHWLAAETVALQDAYFERLKENYNISLPDQSAP